MDRRAFVRQLPVLSVAGAAALSATGCGGLAYVTPGGAPGRLEVDAAQVPPAGALVQGPGMEHPVFVKEGDDGSVTALLLRCTHRGCQPDPVGDRLVCPCHGSEFDADGGVLQGPADQPLVRYRVQQAGSTWTILPPEAGR